MSIEKIQKIIDKEVNNQVETIKLNNIHLKEQNLKYRKEISILNSQISDLQKGDLFSKYAKNVNEDNLTEFLTFIFTEVNNNYGNNQTTKAPLWFYNAVRYWEQRELLFKIYDIVGIKYNKWILAAKMPYEWSEEQCELFIKHLGNHYVCNGAIYDNNLGFWLRNYQRRTVEENIKINCSEIPWQLVLKNPYWVSKKGFNSLINALKGKNSYRIYFSMLPKYQELTQEQLEEMIDAIVELPYANDWNSTANISKKLILSKLNHSSNKWLELYNKGHLQGFSGNNTIIKLEIAKLENSPAKIKTMIDSKLFSVKEIQQELENIHF